MQQVLRPATFLRRYKRFFADAQFPDGSEVTAHRPNTGTMRTLLEEGSPAWLRAANDPKRKLQESLVLLGVKDGVALVDTALPNAIVAEAIEAEALPSLRGYNTLRREVKVGASRIDLLLSDATDGGPDCYIEVKNVTMASSTVPARADFPDAVTERGRKHLGELGELVAAGHRAVQLYLLGRTDCASVGVADEIDPKYGETLRTVVEGGVELIAAQLAVDFLEEEKVALTVRGEVPVEI